MHKTCSYKIIFIAAYSHERKLEEVSVDSQSERDDDNDDDEIKLEIEEEAIPQPINHLALSQEYAGKDMKYFYIPATWFNPLRKENFKRNSMNNT